MPRSARPSPATPRYPGVSVVALGVESGLNDGIATPFVLFFVATAASEADGGVAPRRR